MAIQMEILADLLAAAIRFSDLPGIPIEALPPVQTISQTGLTQKVCPDAPSQCASLAAVFDTEGYVIYVREPIDLKSPLTRSFVVHELVHVLQFKQGGSQRFSSCKAVLKGEEEAYKVQNKYLYDQGSDWREGFSLRFMTCPPDESPDK